MIEIKDFENYKILSKNVFFLIADEISKLIDWKWKLFVLINVQIPQRILLMMRNITVDDNIVAVLKKYIVLSLLKCSMNIEIKLEIIKNKHSGYWPHHSLTNFFFENISCFRVFLILTKFYFILLLFNKFLQNKYLWKIISRAADALNAIRLFQSVVVLNLSFSVIAHPKLDVSLLITFPVVFIVYFLYPV